MNNDLNIRPYSPGDATSVIDLVLSIQRNEFGMSIEAEDQPDLVNVPAFYNRGKGHFWVAEEKGEVIGTIGLLDIGDGQGALRKMFLGPSWRGGERKIASRLLESLVDWAKSHGFSQIYLGTTDWFHAAQRFYVRHGFVEIPREELPASFPVMTVDSRFYRFDLSNG